MNIKEGKMKAAKKVFTEVKRLLKDMDVTKHPGRPDIYTEAYSNCREQGYCLKVYSLSNKMTMAISFAENRNSDDIVVYVGENFSLQGNVPNEEEYKKAKYFRYDAKIKAAEYITEVIKAYIA